ncbi:MAG: D-tyrosyl-tRNA(Tyr) deacylase [Crocinitomicaceae bacterium]|nr:D-tyrosyl-tRNA(Tyr) deacylase [Crocinitomicaceae bacterium]
MRVVIQRVSSSKVSIDSKIVGSIGQGLNLLLGIEEADESSDIEWLVQKIVNLRIFSDAEGKMNLSIKDIDGEILLISQFTLHASYKKGNRPSFIKSARPDQAIPLYESFKKQLAIELGKEVASGEFGADMKVDIQNDGPVTIVMDSRNKE